MSLFTLKPTHATVKAYYAAFADLLKKCCHPYAQPLLHHHRTRRRAFSSINPSTP
jgi:hypothetical protein